MTIIVLPIIGAYDRSRGSRCTFLTTPPPRGVLLKRTNGWPECAMHWEKQLAYRISPNSGPLRVMETSSSYRPGGT